MAVAVSPMVPISWDHNAHSHYYLNEQQQQSYNHYQQAVMPTQYTAMPTPLSGAPPVQHVRTPALPVASSYGNNNTGSGPWTAEMDEILVDNVKRYKWDIIADKFFGGAKTGNACRKRYARVVMERKEPARWNPDRIQKVITAYNRTNTRERMWKPLADELGESWRDVERCCYNQGFKGMTNARESGHNRRRSRATSHRSQLSVNSERSHASAYDDEDPTDDSGIGGDVQSNHQLLQLPPHEYVVREEYHDALPDYGPESYYR